MTLLYRFLMDAKKDSALGYTRGEITSGRQYISEISECNNIMVRILNYTSITGSEVAKCLIILFFFL